MDYVKLGGLVGPELIALAGALLALGWDYGCLKSAPVATRHRVAAAWAALGLMLAMVVMLFWWRAGVQERWGAGVLVLQPLTLAVKTGLYALGVVTIFWSVRQAESRHVGEYYGLMVLAVIGLGLLVSTQHILLVFVALELMSLSFYALTAWRKAQRENVEAALKYFAFGSVSAAFLLFGLSYLYGSTQTLNLDAMGLRLGPGPWFGLAVVFIVIGLSFKIAAAPFHFWAPDVYQVAPTPVLGLIASASKIASFWLLVQVLRVATWQQSLAQHAAILLSVLAASSLVVGNLGALRARHLKRWLAYSAVAHAGYALVGLSAMSGEGFVAVIFYAVVYALASLGVLGVVNVICDQNGRSAEVGALRGVLRSQPWLAVLLGVFLLSLAGLPPLGGFIGKYFLFIAVLSEPGLRGGLLVCVALVFSAVSLYYYLKILKQLALEEPSEGEPPLVVGRAETITLTLLAGAVLALGIWPEPVLRFVLHGLL